MKKILATSMVLGSMLFAAATNHNVLTDTKESKIGKTIAKAIQTEKKKIYSINRAIKGEVSRKEVIVAIKNVGETLFDIKRQDKVSAEAKIKYAINTLNKVKRKIVPIEARLFILEFKGNIKTAKDMISEVKKMIKEKNYQGAGELLLLLKDEMDIVELDINSKELKNKLEEVLKEIQDNKLKESFKDTALIFRNPKIFIRAVGQYPLGVVKAAYLIQEAHILNNAKTKQYKDIIKFIKEAKAELELDNTLGYFYSNALQKEYKHLIKLLNNLEKLAESHKVSKNYKEAENAINKIKNDSIRKKENPRYQIVEPK